MISTSRIIAVAFTVATSGVALYALILFARPLTLDSEIAKDLACVLIAVASYWCAEVCVDVDEALARLDQLR